MASRGRIVYFIHGDKMKDISLGALSLVLTQRKRKLIGFWELRRSWRTNMFEKDKGVLSIYVSSSICSQVTFSNLFVNHLKTLVLANDS